MSITIGEPFLQDSLSHNSPNCKMEQLHCFHTNVWFSLLWFIADSFGGEKFWKDVSPESSVTWTKRPFLLCFWGFDAVLEEIIFGVLCSGKTWCAACLLWVLFQVAIQPLAWVYMLLRHGTAPSQSFAFCMPFFLFIFFLDAGSELRELLWHVWLNGPLCGEGQGQVSLCSFFFFLVPQPPTITHQSPKDYIIDPRENIVIHCEAKGKPHPRSGSLYLSVRVVDFYSDKNTLKKQKLKILWLLSFSWTRNGTHFDLDQHPNVHMRAHSGTLVVDISRERAEHYEGTYQCTSRNKHGTAVSNDIVLRQPSKSLEAFHRLYSFFSSSD